MKLVEEVKELGPKEEMHCSSARPRVGCELLRNEEMPIDRVIEDGKASDVELNEDMVEGNCEIVVTDSTQPA